MLSSLRTDLAAESYDRLRCAGGILTGLSTRSETVCGADVFSVEITDEQAAARLGKPMGHYYTLSLPRTPGRGDASFADLAAAVASLIRRCGVPEGRDVLVAALGNPDITPDALGSLCAGSVLVTRHLKQGGSALWQRFASVSLCRPGVLGTAGVESAAQIAALCEVVQPGLVIAVDALAGSEVSRLCRSIQICDSGIAPGSGVCNDRMRIDRALLGVPVTGVGVPTVGDASAFGEEECLRGLSVTPRDIDSAVRACARLIGYGIDLALHPSLSVEDIDALVG